MRFTLWRERVELMCFLAIKKERWPGFRSVGGGIGLPSSTPGLHSFLMTPLQPGG